MKFTGLIILSVLFVAVVWANDKDVKDKVKDDVDKGKDIGKPVVHLDQCSLITDILSKLTEQIKSLSKCQCKSTKDDDENECKDDKPDKKPKKAKRNSRGKGKGKCVPDKCKTGCSHRQITT